MGSVLDEDALRAGVRFQAPDVVVQRSDQWRQLGRDGVDLQRAQRTGLPGQHLIAQAHQRQQALAKAERK